MAQNKKNRIRLVAASIRRRAESGEWGCLLSEVCEDTGLWSQAASAVLRHWFEEIEVEAGVSALEYIQTHKSEDGRAKVRWGGVIR